MPLLLIAAGLFLLIVKKPADTTLDAFVAGAIDGAAPSAPNGGAVYTGGSGANGTHGVQLGGAPDRVVTS